MSRLTAVSLLLVLASCQFHVLSQEGSAPLQVELDAFSGRPNPQWELTDVQAAEFEKRVRALQPSQGHPNIFDGLGYRGFIVRMSQKPIGGYEEIRVYRGMLAAKRGSQVDAFHESERALERWLLASARGHVDEGTLQYIQTELER